jgi:dTDP-4-dehydrorhamnose 3,5-epimerase
VFSVTPTRLPEVLLVSAPVYRDDRGHFQEVWQQARYEEAGLPGRFVQDNLSFSVRGVLRGLHFQNPEPQGKLVCVLRGLIYDVAVDIRVGSPTFGQWVGIELSAEAGQQLYVPEGFAHGFAVTGETALVLYKCTEFYRPRSEGSVLWNDPDLGIAWPVTDPVLSGKDRDALRLRAIPEERLPRFVAGL